MANQRAILGVVIQPDIRVRYRRSGFTLIELLVSIAIVALLIGIAAPAMGHAREYARRVVCGSNIRQAGLGLNMWADQNRGKLPPSVFLDNTNRDGDQRQDMMTIRLEESLARDVPADRHGWDGMGLLYTKGYLPASSVFYCPSHKGEHGFDRYADRWAGEPGEIVSNYHFRGTGPNDERHLFRMDPQIAMLTDGMRSIDDFNHKVGFNLLRAGLSVDWVEDTGGVIASFLTQTGDNGTNASTNALWDAIDADLVLPIIDFE